MHTKRTFCKVFLFFLACHQVRYVRFFRHVIWPVIGGTTRKVIKQQDKTYQNGHSTKVCYTIVIKLSACRLDKFLLQKCYQNHRRVGLTTDKTDIYGHMWSHYDKTDIWYKTRTVQINKILNFSKIQFHISISKAQMPHIKIF
jgi:hypothetical protein